MAEVSHSAFEGPVYEFSNPVDQARICFVHKVYKSLHAWQQFGTIGIIQWAYKHEIELVFNFYIANLTFVLCIRHRWFIPSACLHSETVTAGYETG